MASSGLAALTQLTTKDFEVFVAALICTDEEEYAGSSFSSTIRARYRNHSIYELLPTVDGLPHRLSQPLARSPSDRPTQLR